MIYYRKTLFGIGPKLTAVHLGYGQNQLHKEVKHGARSKELSF